MEPPQAGLHDQDFYISFIQNFLLSTSMPRHHPMRAPCVLGLALARFDRYTWSNEAHDLDRGLLHFTEAIFLPLPWNGCPFNIIQIFCSITLALFHRANESRKPQDIKRSIVYLRYLRGQSLEAFNVPRNHITGILVHALAIHAQSEPEDVIEEMAVLCHDLLNSDTSTTSLIDSIMAFVQGIKAQSAVWRERREPPEKVIECLRQANARLPDLHEVSLTLAFSLISRSQITNSNDDYEEGMTILDKVIASHTPGDSLRQYWERALQLIASSATSRSIMNGKPEYLEQALSRVRALLTILPREDSFRPLVVQILARLEQVRFEYFGDTGGVQDGHSNSSEIPSHPSFRDMNASLAGLSGGKSPTIATLHQHLGAILSTDRITDEVDIEEAVKFYRLLLTSSHPSSIYACVACISVGFLLFRTFLCTDKTEYLDEAISILRGVVNNPGLQLIHFTLIRMLILLRSLRFKRLSHREDINAIMELLPVAVNDERGSMPERFQLSCSWAWLARFLGHPCVSTAYDCAISLMQDTLTFAPTLDVQHSRLVAIRGSIETMPLGYASYLVHTGRLEEAIEILERGRALIWSEMRGLRTSIDRLRATDSLLADNFTAINRDLERLTLTVFPTTSEGGGDYDLAGMDPFGNLVVQQRKLLNERDKLISRVQALPGFETFLKALPFNALQSAAADGPIIIINHCRWRSDILILLHNSPPSLIPTTHSFFGHANKLRDRLLSAQDKGLDSAEYDAALRDVLKELYEIVGRPVIQRLDELGVPRQSRVWWCPTSVFCTLPLHAMGPIPSRDNTDKYFLDLYIPSYTTSLSALIESRKLGSQTLDKPSILLVAQPDSNMPKALEEMQVVQAVGTKVTTLLGAMTTPTTVLERLRDHRFVHIVSHGILVTGKPFEAWFKLYDGKRLSLLDIVRSRLPDAEFAFLSACSTAQLTDESLADEGLHLAAAMQHCGFRSVVGTMWKVADTDGKFLAGNFYRSVFPEKGQGGRYYERTAKALRGAVRKLRGRRGTTLERWVNFVHYGA